MTASELYDQGWRPCHFKAGKYEIWQREDKRCWYDREAKKIASIYKWKER